MNSLKQQEILGKKGMNGLNSIEIYLGVMLGRPGTLSQTHYQPEKPGMNELSEQVFDCFSG
jgi:hypothetical protein